MWNSSTWQSFSLVCASADVFTIGINHQFGGLPRAAFIVSCWKPETLLFELVLTDLGEMVLRWHKDKVTADFRWEYAHEGLGTVNDARGDQFVGL